MIFNPLIIEQFFFHIPTPEGLTWNEIASSAVKSDGKALILSEFGSKEVISFLFDGTSFSPI